MVTIIIHRIAKKKTFQLNGINFMKFRLFFVLILDLFVVPSNASEIIMIIAAIKTRIFTESITAVATEI